MQNDFLLNTVRSQRRTFLLSAETEKRENVDYIKILYDMSEAKAQEVLRILPKEQLKELKERDTGALRNKMVDLTNFIEVTLNEQDDFLKVRETLTRIVYLPEKKSIVSILPYIT